MLSYRLVCVICGQPWSPADGPIFDGCPRCGQQGRMGNFTVELDLDSLRSESGDWRQLVDESAPGLWRWGKLLPVDPGSRISLGEGQTPLIRLERLGDSIGLHNLYVKDESRGPTWSYKDRLCTVAVSKAVEEKAEIITVSSTGNHGAATAAYAARSGRPCVVFTTVSVPDVMKTLMQSFGAAVVALESAWDRWRLMRQMVKNYGWYPASGYQFPPIGSNPFGIEGYKTIAWETWQQLGQVPDWVVVPTCYGDGLMGIWKGWRELRDLGMIDKTPAMIAAEVYGSLAETLSRHLDDPVEVEIGPSPAFSINTPIGTHQSLLALRESRGTAEPVKDVDLIALQKKLAREEGLYAEAAAVAAVAAVERLRTAGKIKPDEVVVIILTSSGLKDPQATAASLPPVPKINPDVEELKKALRDTYGVTISLS